jgi:hypothetical protein
MKLRDALFISRREIMLIQDDRVPTSAEALVTSPSSVSIE